MDSATTSSTKPPKHPDFQSFEDAISILSSAQIHSKKSTIPLFRARLTILVLALAMTVIFSASISRHLLTAEIAIFIVAVLWTVYAVTLAVAQFKKFSSVCVIADRLPAETTVIQSLTECSVRALELAQQRIETQITCFAERSHGTDLFPGILLGIGTVFVALDSTTHVTGVFPSSLTVSHLGILWPAALAAVGLGMKIGNVLGSFDLAHLRECQFYIESAMRLKNPEGAHSSHCLPALSPSSSGSH